MASAKIKNQKCELGDREVCSLYLKQGDRACFRRRNHMKESCIFDIEKNDRIKLGTGPVAQLVRAADS